MAKAHGNGVWKWVLGVLLLFLLPAVAGAIYNHEQRITRVETTIEIKLAAQAGSLSKIHEKLDRFLERTNP